MTDKDKVGFAEIMSGLAENFGAKLSKPGMSLRFQALKDFSLEQVRAASIAILKSRKYASMPTIAEFLEYLGDGPAALEDRALMAATDVLRAVRKVGLYQSVKFEDPVTMAVIERCFGGWVSLCENMESEKWFLRDFQKYYSVFLRKNIKKTGYLAGIFDNYAPVMIRRSQNLDTENALICAETSDKFKRDRLPMK